MSLVSGLRARARDLAPASLRRAVRALRATVGGHQKLLFHAPRHVLATIEPARSVAYRVGTLDDLWRLGPEHDYDRAAVELLTLRLAAGDQLVLGELAGEPVFTGWVCVGAIDLPTVRVTMPRELAYAYKLFTRADRRGLGLMRGFYGHVAGKVLGPEVEGLVAAVISSNVDSQQAHLRAGFRQVGRFWDLHVGPAALALTDAEVARCIGRRLAATYG